MDENESTGALSDTGEPPRNFPEIELNIPAYGPPELQVMAHLGAFLDEQLTIGGTSPLTIPWVDDYSLASSR